MKKIISIEKVSNGFIVTNGNTKRVYDGSPLEFELDQIHQMLYNSKEGDSHTIVIEVDPPVFTSQDHDSIDLCGLLWDKENISVGGTEKDGHHYFTWAEAMEAAEKQGKRLPTADEWKALCGLGSTWDEKLKGRWFGGTYNTDHKGAIFLPSRGHYDKEDVLMVRCGFYWSSSSNIGVCLEAHGLRFGRHNAYMGHFAVDYRFPLRLVRDIVK